MPKRISNENLEQEILSWLYENQESEGVRVDDIFQAIVREMFWDFVEGDLQTVLVSLLAHGLINYTFSGRVVVTPKGIEEASKVFLPQRTNDLV